MDNLFYHITGTQDKYYNTFKDIYSVSFPIYEQRDEKQQAYAFTDTHYHLLATIEDDVLVSFISYWEFDTYVYIEHLAVNPGLRGRNAGSKTLSAFAEHIQKTIILEIDPPVDEISRKRLRFYEKLGYKTNPYKHFHPAYMPQQYEPHELLVLSNPASLDKAEYKQFYKDLKSVVMK